MGERILAINPACRLTMIDDFVSLENLDQMLDKGFDYIIDAIDNVRAVSYTHLDVYKRQP